MSVTTEKVQSISLPKLRRLVRVKEKEPRVEALSRHRDQRLKEARKIQAEIDELINKGFARMRRKRMGPSVRQLCLDVFQGQKNLRLTAIKVKRAIVAEHPHRESRNFYNQVYIALTRSEEFKKLKTGGFLLDGRALTPKKQ